MNARKLLLAVAVVFAITETADIPHTGIPAAVFAVFFAVCTAWLWRRGSLVAAIILALLFLFEVTQAHTWKGIPEAMKVFTMALGSLGLAAVAAVLVDRFRPTRRSQLQRPA